MTWLAVSLWKRPTVAVTRREQQALTARADHLVQLALLKEQVNWVEGHRDVLQGEVDKRTMLIAKMEALGDGVYAERIAGLVADRSRVEHKARQRTEFVEAGRRYIAMAEIELETDAVTSQVSNHDEEESAINDLQAIAEIQARTWEARELIAAGNEVRKFLASIGSA